MRLSVLFILSVPLLASVTGNILILLLDKVLGNGDGELTGTFSYGLATGLLIIISTLGTLRLNTRNSITCLTAFFFGGILVSLVLYVGFLTDIISPQIIQDGSRSESFIAVCLSWAYSAAIFSWLQKKKKALFLNILLLMCSIPLVVTAVDQASRVLDGDKFYYRPHERFVEPRPGWVNLLRYSPGKSYRGTAAGDLSSMIGDARLQEKRDVLFITDELGYRNRPGQKDRENDVILLGDSFTAGTGCHQDSIFASLLGKNHELEVYNLSNANNPQMELMSLALDLPKIRYRPGARLIWVWFTGNDFYGYYHTPLLDRIMENTFSEKLSDGHMKSLRQRAVLYFMRSPLRKASSRLWRRTRPGSADKVVVRELPESKRMLFYEEYAALSRKTESFFMGDANYEGIRMSLAAGKVFALRNHLHLSVLLIPAKAEVYDGVYARKDPWCSTGSMSGFAHAVMHLADSLGLLFVDARPALAEASKMLYTESGQVTWWYDDSHINHAGHRVISGLIKEDILTGREE